MTQSSLAQRASQAYRGAAVAVPPLRAVILLLNGAISSLQKCLQAQEARCFEEGHAHLTRATAILRGLSLHLDPVRVGMLLSAFFWTYSLVQLCGLAGYLFHSPAWQRRMLDDARYPTGWIPLPGLLAGVAGIGLALLATLHPSSDWDRALVLS